MLPVTWSTVRVFLHVTAATVWVGGQLTLAGLVPGLRSIREDAPRAVARRFNRIAWPAYGVLVVTGVWNIVELDPDWSSDYGHTVIVKIAVVAASGVAAFVHARARTTAMLAIFGALSALTALGALFLGVQLG
jgi:putative copper export protein